MVWYGNAPSKDPEIVGDERSIDVVSKSIRLGRFVFTKFAILRSLFTECDARGLPRIDEEDMP